MDRRKRAADAYRRVRDGGPRSGDAPTENTPRKPSVSRDAESVDHSRTAFTKTTRGGGDATANPDPGRAGTQPPSDPKVEVIASAMQGAGSKRAARLLLAIGSDRAAAVMRMLDPDQVERIAAAMLTERALSRDEASVALDRIGASAIDVIPRGGSEVARQILIAAFGEEEGERWFFRCVPNAPARHFAFLNDLEPHQLHAVIKAEPVSAAALIVAHVDRKLAAAAIGLEPQERRAAIARRIARMGTLSRDVVVRVEEAVREKIRLQGRQVTQAVDGPSTLADILRHLGPSGSEAILSDLREAHVDLEETVRQKLYTTDLLHQLSDRHLADLLREFSDTEVALFLKGKDEALRVRVLRAISERRRLAVSDEYAHLGARHRSDVDAVTREVLERLRELEEDGSILVPREGDRYI